VLRAGSRRGRICCVRIVLKVSRFKDMRVMDCGVWG
jgi:hypothetical protein